jgi:hypothetical protein
MQDAAHTTAPDDPRTQMRGWLMALAVFGLLIAATLAMWGYYGTAVFYEMVIAGFAACF